MSETDEMDDKPRTLADFPVPDELTCRKLLALFAKARPADESGSEPLGVRLKND